MTHNPHLLTALWFTRQACVALQRGNAHEARQLLDDARCYVAQYQDSMATPAMPSVSADETIQAYHDGILTHTETCTRLAIDYGWTGDMIEARVAMPHRDDMAG